MAEAFMAYPELRHPFETKEIHAAGSATVLYQGQTITLDEVGPGDGLLIRPDDLPRVNGFVIKPEGACLNDLCMPLNDTLLRSEQSGNGETRWIDIEAFADLIDQAHLADHKHRVWSFAEVPAKLEHKLLNALAPEFEITDRQGRVVRLADLKGKKALIVTWSSW